MSKREAFYVLNTETGEYINEGSAPRNFKNYDAAVKFAAELSSAWRVTQRANFKVSK